MKTKTLEQPTQLVEMEEKLRNDKTGQYRRELLDNLALYKSQTAHLAQRGDWTPSEFQALELLKKALEKANFILKNSKF